MSEAQPKEKTCKHCGKPFIGTPYQAPETVYDPQCCSISCTFKMRRDEGLATGRKRKK